MVFHGFCALKGQCHGILNFKFFHQSAFPGFLIFTTQVAAGGKEEKNLIKFLFRFHEAICFTLKY
jgi:hypothetical protein